MICLERESRLSNSRSISRVIKRVTISKRDNTKIDKLKEEEITERLLRKTIRNLKRGGMKEEMIMSKQKQEGKVIEIIEMRIGTEETNVRVETKEIIEDKKRTKGKIEEKKETKTPEKRIPEDRENTKKKKQLETKR